MTPHDKAIEVLEKRVKKQYEMTLRNLPYTKKPFEQDFDGELDLVGFRGQEIHIYEVKTNDKDYRDAVIQLKRAREKLSCCGNVRIFYYSARMKTIREIP